MTSHIKKLVKSGASKIRIVHDGEKPKGRTNAANPGSMTKLFDTFNEFHKANSVPIQTKPSEPVARKPNIDQRFKDMGEAMGICPYELREIMNSNFNSDETLIFTLLKKFITAVKLAGAVDLAPTHKMLKQHDTAHQVAMRSWEETCEKVDARNKSLMTEVAEKQLAFNKAWGEILIDLETKLCRNSDLDSLGTWDRLMVMAISYNGDDFCSIVKNKASLNFNRCKTMAPEIIISLPKVAKEIEQHEEEMQWQNWIISATINEMVQKLWEMGVDNDDERDAGRRQQLEWSIIAKSGKTPRRDRWGNLDWNATFDDRNVIVDDFSWEEDLEQQRIERWQESIQRAGSKAVRVKSGNGKKTKV